MKLIFVDRRKTDKNKSAPNRQKLVRRVKKSIKESLPQNIGSSVAGNKTNSTNPVKVASSSLREPYFRYDGYADEPILVIGNDKYDRGDVIHKDDGEGDGEGNGAGQGDNGEDDFIINVAKDEFLDLFFEDCELPNLVKNKYTEKLENKFERAGFSTSGNPSQLSIIRTYKQALGRRKATVNPIIREIDLIDRLLLTLEEDDREQIEELLKQRDLLRNRKKVYENFDPSDLRYRRREAKPVKTVDAVIFMVMDISGSMDERMKTIARRWFALLYAFVKRKYASTELVFIAHTSEAIEMSEDDFFSTRINGGTLVSPALHLINDIIKERYDPNETNIYICHASDGDNWSNDNDAIVKEMLAPGNLLAKIQLFIFIETRNAYYNLTNDAYNTELWDTYINDQYGYLGLKICAAKLNSPDDCYARFRELFKAQ